MDYRRRAALSCEQQVAVWARRQRSGSGESLGTGNGKCWSLRAFKVKGCRLAAWYEQVLQAGADESRRLLVHALGQLIPARLVEILGAPHVDAQLSSFHIYWPCRCANYRCGQLADFANTLGLSSALSARSAAAMPPRKPPTKLSHHRLRYHRHRQSSLRTSTQ